MISITHPRVPTPSLLRRPHPRRYLGAVAATAVLLGPLGSVNAMADPTGQASSPAPGATVDGTTSGTEAGCAWTYKWHTDGTISGGYTEVKWTYNPCGLRIEDRTYCGSEISPGETQWNYSGIVKRTGLWDRATCGSTWVSSKGEERHTGADGSWGSWHEYW
jgi:hypothetical protein